MIQAIKFAAEQGNWGRVIGAIGCLVVGGVMSVFCAMAGQYYFIYPIMSTCISMATAICYGNWGQAAIAMGIGYATCGIQAYMANFTPSGNPAPGAANTAPPVGASDYVGRTFELGTDQVKQTAIERLMPNLISNLGSAAYGVALVKINTEISTSLGSWFGKIGYGFGSSDFSMSPLRGITSPNLPGNVPMQDNIASSGFSLVDRAFNTMNNLISNSAYKNMENNLGGEEWYKNLYHSGMSSITDKIPGAAGLGNFGFTNLPGLNEIAQGSFDLGLDEGTGFYNWGKNGIIAFYEDAKRETLYLIDGSQIGAGQGLPGIKIKVGKYFNLEVSFIAMEVSKIQDGSIVRDFEPEGAFKLIFGPVNIELSNINGVWEKKWHFEKFEEWKLKNSNELELGGTLIDPRTFNACNGELHIRLDRILEYFNSLFFRRD